MLPEPLRLLIAAYAADDLSPRRKKAAVRLLKHSREARLLLRDLQTDGKRLQALPRQGLPADFADMLLTRLPEMAPLPRPAVNSSALRLQAWTHLSAAFAVVLALGLASWMLLVLPGDRDPVVLPPVVVQPQPDAPVVVQLPDTPIEEPPVTLPPTPVVVAPKPAAKAEPKPPRDILTSPATPKLETVKIKPPRLTLVLSAHGLDAADAKASLKRDFAAGDAHRIDLFCRDTHRGLDRLQAVLREKGVRVGVEAIAADAHKRKLRGQPYAVFCEDLTPGDWVSLLGHLGANDRKASDAALEHLALMALVASDQKDLASLFGVDVAVPLAKAKAGLDPKKPVSDGTAQQVVEALEKASNGRKPGDKAALVLSASPQRANPANSREIKQFVDGRRERPAGAVAVMVVLRPAN